MLVASPGPLALENLKDTYAKLLGHKCTIERFLVVGDGGLAATLKRIPHIVTLYQDAGVTCVKASQPPGTDRQQLVEVDQQYRREIMKKSQAKAAMNSAKAKAPAGAPAATTAPSVAKAGVPAAPAEGKRPAEAPAGGDAKKQRNESESETLARMLVQGVVRVLQNRQKAEKGALPIGDLEEEFKALWKVPFNLAQAGEQDAVTFLQKWPGKVELVPDGDTYLVQLAKKAPEKPKVDESSQAASSTAGPNSPTTTPTATKAVATKAPGSVGTAVKAGSVAKAPATAATASTSAPTAAKAAPVAPGPAPVAPAPPEVGSAEPAEAKNGAAIPKRAGGPARPPSTIEDFLWNMHTVIDAFGGPMPLDQLKEAYSKHLGHKCAIERFLVVNEGGLAGTLRRIPHVVTVLQEGNELTLKATQPSGTTKEQLIAADHQYRKQLQAKNAAVKAAAPPAATGTSAASQAKAPAPGTEGERDAKRPKTTEEAETLARMLIQGVVRVLQNRMKDGKGPLPVNDLEPEFKALWKVPFNLQQAGETDVVTFLQKWPGKVETLNVDGQVVVTLAKKGADKKAASKAAAPTGALASSGDIILEDAADTPAPSSAVASSERHTADFDGRPVSSTNNAAALAQLPALRQQAVSMLHTMQELLRKQEALVNILGQLCPDAQL